MLTANEENTNHKSNGLVIKPVCCKNDKECIRFVKNDRFMGNYRFDLLCFASSR